jgi:hypothetical protein
MTLQHQLKIARCVGLRAAGSHRAHSIMCGQEEASDNIKTLKQTRVRATRLDSIPASGHLAATPWVARTKRGVAPIIPAAVRFAPCPTVRRVAANQAPCYHLRIEQNAALIHGEDRDALAVLPRRHVMVDDGR